MHPARARQRLRRAAKIRAGVSGGMLMLGLLTTEAAVAAPPPAPLCGNGPLEILLTNDDGFDAAGIRALRSQLAAAGHRVTLAAPDYNASGSGLSFTWSNVRVTRDPNDPAAFAVGGSPATTVVLAATALYPEGRRPDLVVSGINHGPNTGSLLMLSGTLGAALAGTLLLDPPIPGMAVSAERMPGTEPPEAPASRAHFEAIGAHVAQLIAATRGWFCESGRLVRRRSVLNVNYPARPMGEIRGTVLARQGSATDLRVGFTTSGDGEYRSETRRADAVDGLDTDNHWLAEGYVTVTPVSGAITDAPALRSSLKRRLQRL
jgi:5'/3'-nucleotidase SurE